MQPVGVDFDRLWNIMLSLLCKEKYEIWYVDIRAEMMRIESWNLSFVLLSKCSVLDWLTHTPELYIYPWWSHSARAIPNYLGYLDINVNMLINATTTAILAPNYRINPNYNHLKFMYANNGYARAMREAIGKYVCKYALQVMSTCPPVRPSNIVLLRGYLCKSTMNLILHGAANDSWATRKKMHWFAHSDKYRRY